MPADLETINPGRESASKFNRNNARLLERGVISSDGSILIGQTPAGTDLRARATPRQPDQVITAKLTAKSGSKYSWSEERRTDAGAWESVSGGRSGTTSADPAYDLDETGATDWTNRHVLLARVGVKDASGNVVPGWLIAALTVTTTTNYGVGADYQVLMSLSGAVVWDYPRWS
jgi:hypothetical protein